MNGTIFNIQKFCVNDGPGIRTTIFLKGCPLKCIWCHNPESQAAESEIMFYRDKCIGCGMCERICKNSCHFFENNVHIFEREKCVKCFACTDYECGAIEKAGKIISSEEAIKEAMKDKIFYDNSGGGITLSGGEPLFQFEFSLDILKKAKEKDVHTAIETCGFANKKKIIEIAEYVDLFLFDYKETDLMLHKRFTGVDNSVILENIKTLNELKKNIILRCPIIPGYNDRTEHFMGICNVANEFEHILHIELEPYHSLGEGKYISLGHNVSEIRSPTEDEKNSWLVEIRKNTDKKVKFA